MKRYEEMLMEILFFPAEDIICTSIPIDENNDNTSDMPEFPNITFLPGM